MLPVPLLRHYDPSVAITCVLAVTKFGRTCPAAMQPVVLTGGGEDKGRFQTALLTLGATHTHFGHVKEALTALNETVHPALGKHTQHCPCLPLCFRDAFSAQCQRQ